MKISLKGWVSDKKNPSPGGATPGKEGARAKECWAAHLRRKVTLYPITFDRK
jgi:hypothetical protein